MRVLLFSGRTLPLEMLPIGQFDIVYRSPLDVRSGELPVLPLSIYGALAMSHGPDGADTAAADEFFIYKFDRWPRHDQNPNAPLWCRWHNHSDLALCTHMQFLTHRRQSSGLAGLSFDEGDFGVFGYVTQVRIIASPITSYVRLWVFHALFWTAREQRQPAVS